MLATTRASLGIPEERLVRLEPLSTDGPDSPAVSLFLDRVGPGVDGDDADQRARVVDIVARVDGLPLAIELAARQVARLGLAPVHDRLDDRLDLLLARTARHPAHGDLRSLIAWSTSTLDDERRDVLRGLAGFAATFTLEMAEQLLAASGKAPGSVPLAVAELVDRSLVIRTTDDRYRLLDTIRAVTREDTPAAVARLNALLPDLQAAVTAVAGLKDATRAAALARAVRGYAYHTQRIELLAVGRGAVELLDEGDESSMRADAHVTDAVHALFRGDFDRAASCARIAIDDAGPADDVAAARAWALAEARGNPTLLAWVHFARAELAADRDPQAALEDVQHAITHSDRVDNYLIGGVARSVRSAIRARHGDPGEALADYRRALQHWRRDPNPTLQTTTLRNLSVLLARIGRDEEAALLDGAAGQDERLFEAEAERVQRARDSVTQRLGPERAGHSAGPARGWR